jgi:hypothetical protein
MRSHPSKEYAVWLDHSGNYLRFREEWDELYTLGVQELDKRVEKTKKEPTEKEKLAAKCPKCQHLWPKGTDTCPSCGYIKQRRNQVEAVAGSLEELFDGSPLKDDRQSWYSELLWYAAQRNYNPHWASHKYRERFGVWPRGLSNRALPTSPKVANWVKSRMIAYAKSKGKYFGRDRRA